MTEAEELQYGILLGETPRPEPEDERADGSAVTRLSSWWNHLRCLRCGHTFRRGDSVRVNDRERTVLHLAPVLNCGIPRPEDAGADEEIAAFREGLRLAWPATQGVRLRRLAADDWRIPKGPDDVREANVCLECGHTFRPGEYVIVCPCRPEQAAGPDGPTLDAGCGRAVHRDPAAGLSCWDSWRPDGTVPVCPVTQTAVRWRLPR
ncbi:MAG TPA: hypothetical protein VFQ44_11945 [Streptosporangiaceae bacterium]|nr:hypothetical protein [Streptosporangiaceae bacterium]